jgi:hypothetical protein
LVKPFANAPIKATDMPKVAGPDHTNHLRGIDREIGVFGDPDYCGADPDAAAGIPTEEFICYFNREG